MPVHLRALILLTGLIVIMLAVVPQSAVHAGFFDRIKDIYNTPEKISELEGQYMDAKAELAEQQRQLAEAMEAAAEYERKQQELAAQNEQLIEQNASLQAELAQAKEERRSLVDKLITAGIVLAALIIAYIISLRLWRYVVWRRQRTSGRSGISG